MDTSRQKRTRKSSQRAKDIIELSPDKGDSMRKNLPKKKVKVPALPEDISHPPDDRKLVVFRVWLNKGLLKRVGPGYAPTEYWLYLHVVMLNNIYIYSFYNVMMLKNAFKRRPAHYTTKIKKWNNGYDMGIMCVMNKS